MSSGERQGSNSGTVSTILALAEALGSALDIDEVLRRAYPILCRLVPSDYGALGVSSTGRPEDYRWIATGLPASFFAAYPEMAPHDFVRKAVARRINVVLRDDEMVPRAELEANMMYLRAREVGAPLEHVMAVMLHVDERWQAGLSLYRDRRRPFSPRERATLQDMTPLLVNAVRNCHRFGEIAAVAARSEAELEAALRSSGAAMVIIEPPKSVVWRSKGATSILERWFSPHELGRTGAPEPLLCALAEILERPLATHEPWVRERARARLDVAFARLPEIEQGRYWMLFLSETLPLPRAVSAKLTYREQEVTQDILAGMSNEDIAPEGGKVGTVKKHVWNIFNKLGVGSRAQLVALIGDVARREALRRL